MTNSFILDEFMRAWEIPAIPDEQVENSQVGIVLGGMISYDHPLHRLQFMRSADRLHQAVILYKKGKIKKILFVGGSGLVGQPEEREALYAKEYLLKIGIPEADMLIESNSRNTAENAKQTKQLFEALQIRGKNLLITSGLHMRRAKACFTKVGLDVQCFSTDRYSGQRKFELDHCLVPKASVLAEWDLLFHEWIGYLSYKMAGYL
jgi:uncharacterized SAM-binding protein YcdF (DUF218 family)